MPSLIRPNRTEVSRSFPVLGFTIRVGRPGFFEVAVATDPSLFDASAKARRTSSSFWSSRCLGPLPAERGDAVYLLPAAVLGRFAGQPRLYYALATFSTRDRTNPEISLPPVGAMSSIGISASFSGTTRRLAMLQPGRTPSRSGTAYTSEQPGAMEWAGDSVKAAESVAASPARSGGGTTTNEAQPSTTDGPAPGAAPAATVAMATGLVQPFDYDDGYGPLSEEDSGSAAAPADEGGATTTEQPAVAPPTDSAPELAPTDPPADQAPVTDQPADPPPPTDDGTSSDSTATPTDAVAGGSGTSSASAAPDASARADGSTTAGGASTFDVYWPDVQLIPQPSGRTCRATAAAMVAGWAGQASLPTDPDGRGNLALETTDTAVIADLFHLTLLPPANHSIDELVKMLREHGPLWVTAIVNHGRGFHAIVVTGVYGDGTADGTFVRINDPWDRAPGTPDHPGEMLDTHDHGSTYIMRFSEFLAEYEGVPNRPSLDSQQLMYARDGAGSRTPSVGASTLGLRATALEDGSESGTSEPETSEAAPSDSPEVAGNPVAVGVGVAILGAVVTRLLGNEGDISWELDQLNGMKYPKDEKTNVSGEAFTTTTVSVPGLVVSNRIGDDITADIEITFQSDGRALGNVTIAVVNANDQVGSGLKVTAHIVNDANTYASGSAGGPSFGAIGVNIQYLFDSVLRLSPIIGKTEVKLFGNGSHSMTQAWTSK